MFSATSLPEKSFEVGGVGGTVKKVRTFESSEKRAVSTAGGVSKKSNKSSLSHSSGDIDTGYTRIEDMLMREKASNKLDTWVKMDKVSRLSRLAAFSVAYGTSESWSLTEIDSLKRFLSDNLTKGRLKRASEVIYNRSSQEISSIPCLDILRPEDGGALSFSLGAINPKRMTTIKSLTPKRLPAISGSIEKGAQDSNEIDV